MIYAHFSYRTFLKEVLVDKTAKNPSYSLRAMARQLGVATSSLSEVLAGKSGFSLMAARKIALKLRLSPEETEYFCLLVQLEATKDLEIRESLLARIRGSNPNLPHQVHDLSVDQFMQISEWYHSAILELVSLDGKDMTAALAAKRLGTTKLQAEVAIDRLLRLELLERDCNGRLRRIHNRLIARSNAQQDKAQRKFFRQMLEKASSALETQSQRERVSGYETLPFSTEAVPEARSIMERFFAEMIALSRRTARKDSVYHLNVHFFNLTPGKE